jgi:V/A-type H+-transporting ATPase subunit B
MSFAEYRGLQAVDGPLVFVDGVRGVGYDEAVEIVGPDGRPRRGRVVLIEEDRAVVQVFAGTSALVPDGSRVRFLGRHLEMALSPSILGRTFDGLGEPRDGCGAVLGGFRSDINGRPINPMARAYPRDFIHTGLSVIDTLMTLIRGQKLPIFSSNGLPHNRLAVQIASQSRITSGDNFAVVFVGIGIRNDDAAYFIEALRDAGKGQPPVVFLNLASDPVIERLAVPRTALTAAEYLAFDLGYHVLVVMTDMTNYCEALRELAVARGEVPSRKGYPGYLYSDLASLYERAGVLRDRPGSLTQLPILTMPNDDITHPIPDLTGFITEGQVVLSREQDAQGAYPPVDIPASLSRLMKDSIGKGYTRDDHPDLAGQLFASYSRVQEIRALAGVVGEDELGATEKSYLRFGDAFERRFLSQGDQEDREIGVSLDLAWELLAILPRTELNRLPSELVRKHLPSKATK